MTEPEQTWRILYVGGKVVAGSGFAAWAAAPDDGILRVEVTTPGATPQTPDFVQPLYGRELYFATPDGVFGHSDDTPELLAERYPGAAIKRGQWASRSEFARTLDAT